MSWSRRQALRTTAGAGAWFASGCPGPNATPAFAWVGQDPARGHQLREAKLRDIPPRERIATKIAIVGTGVAGLSALWQLRRAGFTDVRVFELEDTFGGTARSGQLPRSAYPMGAHYLPAPPSRWRALVDLLDDLGLVVARSPDGTVQYDPRAICRAPVERHRYRGLWFSGLYPAQGESPQEHADMVALLDRLRALDARRGADGRPLFDLPVGDSSAELRHLDRLSMAQWLAREGLQSRRLRWLLDYGCRDDYGCTLEQTSAFAGLHHLLARGLEDGHDRELLTWPGGNGQLCAGMAQLTELRRFVHPNTAIVAADPDTGTLKAWDFGAQQATAIAAEVVLWAAPRFVLAAVVPPGTDPLGRNELTYTPWLVANVQVSQTPRGPGAPLAWDNVETRAQHLGYVVANHLEPLDRRSEPGAVLTFYEPRSAPDPAGLAANRKALLDASLTELGHYVIAQIDGMHPGIAAKVTHVHIARWGHAMVRPTPNMLFGGALQRAAAPIGRIIPCAADVGGLPLFEQAFAQGTRAAQQALDRLDV